jgi:hypothetical protein
MSWLVVLRPVRAEMRFEPGLGILDQDDRAEVRPYRIAVR